MEAAMAKHIRSNIAKLVYLTTCDFLFCDLLWQEEVIDDVERGQLKAIPDINIRSSEFYTMLLKKKSEKYMDTVEVLKKREQYAAADLLMKHYDDNNHQHSNVQTESCGQPNSSTSTSTTSTIPGNRAAQIFGQPNSSTSTSTTSTIPENRTADALSYVISGGDSSPICSQQHRSPGSVKTVMEKSGLKVRVFLEDMKYLLDKVGNRKLIFVSICGKTRSGKSFMLSLFIHYLNSERPSDWITSFNRDPNKFFKWEGGSKPKTDGVSVWSEPFILNEPNGDEVAVVLMDCQGAFDRKTTPHQNSLIFALASLLSSVFIYNVKEVITEEAIHPFIVFMDAALRAGNYSHAAREAKILQKLIILNRDVDNSCYKNGNYSKHSIPTGALRDLFKETFHPRSDSAPEVIDSRKQILDCFEQVEVFALPYPGYKLDNRADPSDLEPEFTNYSTQFMESLFSPRNISKNTKTIQGQTMTGSSCLSLFEKLAETFNNDGLPQIHSFYENFVENENNKAKSTEMAKFKEKLGQFVAAEVHGVSDQIFQQYLESLTNEILASFQQKFFFGGEELKSKFAERLKVEMLEYSKALKNTNVRKREAKVSADKLEKEKRDKEVALDNEKKSLIEAEQIKTDLEAMKQLTINQAAVAVEYAEKQLKSAQEGKSLIKKENYMYNKAYNYTIDATVGQRVVTEKKLELDQAQYNAAILCADTAVSEAENKLRIAKEYSEQVKSMP